MEGEIKTGQEKEVQPNREINPVKFYLKGSVRSPFQESSSLPHFWVLVLTLTWVRFALQLFLLLRFGCCESGAQERERIRREEADVQNLG